MKRELIYLLACLLTGTCALALAADQVILRGCLLGGQGDLYLAVRGEVQSYKLTGATASLKRYIGKEVSVQGRLIESTAPSFAVAGLRQVFAVPHPKLNPSFANIALWKREIDPAYGITYAHPRSWAHGATSDRSMVYANFAAVILGSFTFPQELYAGSDFFDGTFGVLCESANHECAELCGVWRRRSSMALVAQGRPRRIQRLRDQWCCYGNLPHY